MFPTVMDLQLAPDDRRTLEQMLRQSTLSQAIAQRTRVVLAVAAGDTYATIAPRFACTDRFIAIWKRHFPEGGVLALADAPRAGAKIVPPTSLACTSRHPRTRWCAVSTRRPRFKR